MVMKIRQTLGLGAGVGLIGWGIGRLIERFAQKGIATVQFSTFPIDLPLGINVRQQIIAGVDPSLAGRLLAVFGGGEITAMFGLIMAVLAGIAVAFVGTFVVNALKGVRTLSFLPTGKKPIGKITAIMVYGTLISAILVGWFDGAVSVPTFGFVIASVIYFLIIGWVYVGLRGLGLKQLPLPE